MAQVKNLTDVTVEEQKKFLESFKYVFSDMDGVIWLLYKAIPGAPECCEYLQRAGKEVAFVTNNNLLKVKFIQSKLAENKFCNENVVTPGSAIINYLKGINFNKTVYLIGTHTFKEDLKEAGFTLAEEPPLYVETIYDLINNVQDDLNIGVVIFETDLNINRLKLQKAATYLSRPDCLFLAGALDEYFITSMRLLGNGPFYRVVTEFAGREALHLAKPSGDFAKFVMTKFGIENPKDVLFIGDSIKNDMTFATNGGFNKLLVLSGEASIHDLDNWKYPEECKPEYYVNSLDDLKNILQFVYNLDKI